MSRRRVLSFERVDEIMPDVERLLAGHETVGRWSLGQICNHLAMTFRGSVEGFPTLYPWAVRRLLGPILFRQLDRMGHMREGFKIPGDLTPKPGLDAVAEAEALRTAIRVYQEHTGPFAENPVLGRMDRRQWDRLQCIHSAHHLSFAVPVTVGVPT
jgi:hypothetical protein